ncbi:phosphopantetheine-binding protein [Fulvimonas sp. R45]|uniref:phosphopantetheine-binding protein n=1 Tax=Fulvimonas sp. R45 TaxID=3045937 RepID=UPI00265E8E50|nr:phosphopantetheine-binding protein [Fulvimonas sp. R45]MDO1527928.1 phosphopantetheine-binding protein [Fulvimonas sp. R45]
MNATDTAALAHTALEQEIAQLVIDTLNLEDLDAADIPPAQPLFGEGLGLDSVDALELALALQKRYGIRVESDAKHARDHFATVANLAAYVASQQAACAS